MGFLDNVANKAVPEGSSLAKPLMLAFTGLLASGVPGRKQEPASAPGTSPASHPEAGGLLGGIRWTARKIPAERSWRRSEILGWQRAKSTDPSRLTRFGSRSVDY